MTNFQWTKVLALRWMLSVLMLLLLTEVKSQQAQAVLLNDAYKTKSSQKLKLFIDRWAKSGYLSKAKWSATKNDTIKAFNEVYRHFYLNNNDDYNSPVPTSQPAYIVINDNPLLVIADSIPIVDPEKEYPAEQDYATLEGLTWREGNHQQALGSYVPDLLLPKVVVLSLTNGYASMIEKFLEVKPDAKKQTEGGHDEKKVAFLGFYLPMVQRHWGHYWNYLSYPDIKRIVFNRQLTAALVSYSLSSRTALACYLKTEQGWRLIEQRTLYIQ